MPGAKALTLAEVEEGKEYALLLTTNAGAWRYLIGDTIKFTSKEHFELVITGRTKHFLSLVGEHLSVDNMNAAIAHVAEQLNVEIPEYTVAGVEYDRLFAHQWFVGVQGALPDATKVRNLIDEQLSRINDDYAVERKSALKEVLVEVLPAEVFLDYLRSKGKEGGQNKFPRVIRNSQLQEWKSFIQQRS
jgi:hypothetical protein